jgi:hypothetical protein
MQGLVKFFNVERGYGFVHNEADPGGSTDRTAEATSRQPAIRWSSGWMMAPGGSGSRRRDCCPHRFPCLISHLPARLGTAKRGDRAAVFFGAHEKKVANRVENLIGIPKTHVRQSSISRQ